jgi:hypothetical protein
MPTRKGYVMVCALIKEAIAPFFAAPNDGVLDDEALYGMKVEIIESFNNGWARIRTPYRYESCVEEKFLLRDKDATAAWETADKRVVLQAFADVLDAPKVQGKHIISLTRGALIRLLSLPEKPGGWAKVGLCDGRTGYMKEKFLGRIIPSDTYLDEKLFRKFVVETARSYLGTQYRWGGKTPLGIDCSGLCSMAYWLNGVAVYRNASMPEGFPVHKIPFESKKPGDLFFYPGHVAMYIGDDLYIHSTGRDGDDGVVINSLDPGAENYRADLPKILTGVGSIY